MSISSVLSANVPATSTTACSAPLGSFEVNAKEYGPAAASALGVAKATSEGADAIVSFSQEGLEKMFDTFSSTYEAISDGLEQVADVIADGIEAAGATLDVAGKEVANWADTAVEGVEIAAKGIYDAGANAAEAISDGVGNVAEGAMDLTSTAVDELSSIAGSIAAYAALGVAAVAATLDELA